ncbi:hypothetical protein HCN44_006680 [Aphidius gifuensis]|uniref:chymotrypsin n=1 Tax=Aphidius gifuensis TaxID=684658 RepID=A0A834Y0M1_APHGI|nr:trypsin-3-like [Aphidius gifuensis]KAF7995573.1 hypothetical protein HCN44_006680 [Aphidius gifuensis]
MYLIKFFYLTIFIISNVNANNDTSVKSVVKQNEESRIINGTKATDAQFPFMVSLRRALSGNHFCGGSIISERWVITAAHCMFDSNNYLITKKSLYVVGGKTNILMASQTSQKREISKLIAHPNYNAATLTQDVALLLTNRPFEFTQYVKPISMSIKLSSVNTMCYAVGWGYLKENGTVSNDLMFVGLPLLSSSTCRILLGPLPRGVICAGFKEGGKDACQGDSGGPLICDHEINGIVSGGEGCARPKLPGFYTSVPYYKSWINQVMQSNGSILSSKNGAKSKFISLTLAFVVVILSMFNI